MNSSDNISDKIFIHGQSRNMYEIHNSSEDVVVNKYDNKNSLKWVSNLVHYFKNAHAF